MLKNNLLWNKFLKNDLCILITNYFEIQDYVTILKNEGIQVPYNEKSLLNTFNTLNNKQALIGLHLTKAKESYQCYLEEITGGMQYIKSSDLISSVFKKTLEKLNIEVFNPFNVYENNNKIYIDILGITKMVDTHDIIENGFVSLIIGNLTPEQKQPNINDIYFYKVYNMATKQFEIKSANFSTSIDMQNYHNKNCFKTKELCEQFAVIDM